jgi:hypothetical protein
MATGTMTTEFLHLNNPKNYKFLPPSYVKHIRNAGKPTVDGNHVKDLFN